MVDAPRRIDIYVDGSWLYKGKDNPGETGGWGAAIVETQGDLEPKLRIISGGTAEDIHSSGGAETYGILQALQDVRRQEFATEPKPTVALHTDQSSLCGYIKAVKEGKQVKPRSLHKEYINQIIELATEMGITPQYIHDARYRGGQSENHLSAAHHAAAAAAWAARLEKQGYISMRGHGRMEGETALAYINRSSGGGTGQGRA